MHRIGGICHLKIQGKQYTAGDGEFSFSVGGLKREAKLSSSGVAGFVAKPQVPFVEGELILTRELDVAELFGVEDATLTLELYSGKTVVIHNAYFAGDGEGSTNGTLKVRFEGLKGELING